MATTKSTAPKKSDLDFLTLREKANETLRDRKNKIQTTPINITNNMQALAAMYTEVIVEQNEYMIKLLEMLVEKSSG